MSMTSDEYQTPKKYIIAAREVMGSIDLDPACSFNNYLRLQKYVKEFYAEDGLERPWCGNIWLNPPYSKPNLTVWTEALLDFRKEYNQLHYLIPSYTAEKWYQKLLKYSDSLCLPNHRINHLINGKFQTSPRFSSTFFYLGYNHVKFKEVFSQFGKCFLNNQSS